MQISNVHKSLNFLDLQLTSDDPGKKSWHA